jgi:hypothetical protein
MLLVFLLLISVAYALSLRTCTSFFPRKLLIKLRSSTVVRNNKCSTCANTDSPSFILDMTQGPLEKELSNENLIKIVSLVASDQQCNMLCWKCLGYSFHSSNNSYTNTNVFPAWRERFPNPPDIIGVKRDYSPDVGELKVHVIICDGLF